MQLTSMLVLLLLLHHVFGKETAKDVHIIEKIESCPDIGYFFKRESKLNAIELSCYLCFCQDNDTAVCWPRDDRRCDKKQYYHIGRRKRDSRSRRSPGLTDIFFRDATRDVFNRQAPEQCKPHESSFSEGCPPADWCIGCTVCDCDANGRWDCHILSFCPDNKGKKHIKKRKGSLRNKNVKRQLPMTKPTPVRTTTKSPTKKYPSKNTNKNKKTPAMKNKKQINSKQNKNQNGTSKKTSQIKNSKISLKKKNVSKKTNQQVTKKGVKSKPKTKTPVSHNTRRANSKIINQADSTTLFAQNILKQLMASVEKILYENQKKMNESINQININNKMIQKRSMPKHVNKNLKKTIKNIKNSKLRPKIENKINQKQRSKQIIKRKLNEKMGRYTRRKREVNLKDIVHVVKEFRPNGIKCPKRKFIFSGPETKSKHNISTSNRTEEVGLHNNTSSEFMLTNSILDIGDKSNYFRYTLYNKNAFGNKDNVTPSHLKINKGNKFITEIKSSLPDNFVKPTIDVDKVTQTTIKYIYSTDRTYRERNFNKTDRNIDNKTIDYVKEYSVEKNITCSKICVLKKILKKFVSGFRKNNSTLTTSQNKKVSISNKVKNFIGNIFMKNITNAKKSTQYPTYPFKRRNIVKVLCKTIGSCKFNSTNKLLQYRLNDLREESKKIFKSVRIINGLLKLLDIDRKTTSNSGKKILDDYERTLTVILKDEYESYNLVNLTDTQRTQITYIKENTLTFIQSMEKFAYILNDIIKILTSTKVNKLKTSSRYYRCAKKPLNVTIKNTKNDSLNGKLESLKNLLGHYNLVQNKFMKEMYDVITSLESATKTSSEIKLNKVSGNNENNNGTAETDIYVKNIITNLRKLKDLAQKLSFKSRRKRSTMGDDDAIEYLLFLMEYILKQSRPIYVSPVNDGIDLIIEAIKSAPDIKPIKKKVLDYTTTTENEPNSSYYQDIDEPNTTQSSVNTFKVFESMDEEDTNMVNDSSLNDIKYFRGIMSENEFLTLKPKIISNSNENVDIVERKIENGNAEIQRYKIFGDYDESDFPYDNITKVMNVELETSTALITSVFKLPKRTFSPNEKKMEKVNDKKITLEWVEESYDTETNQLQHLETTTEKILKATRTVTNKDKYAKDISSVSEEHDEGNDKKNKFSSDEIYKRQMNLFNTLDYGTEKSLIESDSREDKYNSESFPLYFV